MSQFNERMPSKLARIKVDEVFGKMIIEQNALASVDVQHLYESKPIDNNARPKSILIGPDTERRKVMNHFCSEKVKELEGERDRGIETKNKDRKTDTQTKRNKTVPELILEIDGVRGFIAEGGLGFDPMDDDSFDGDGDFKTQIRRLVKALRGN